MASFLGFVLFWIGRAAALGSAGLAIYIAFEPAVAGPYGRGLGIFVICIFGACAWLIGSAARYILRGD
jgi:hypothetical protein